MVIGLSITNIVFLWAPRDVELALGFEVLDPAQNHVYDFWYFFLKYAFGEGLHSDVVNLELSGGLWVPHLNEAGL